MNRKIHLSFLAFKFMSLLMWTSSVAWTSDDSTSLPPQNSEKIYVIRIQGTIDPATTDFLHQGIQTAESENGEALVVELDTPGGLLASVRDMAQAIDRSKVPVIVYVTPAGASATSAGALLALASHVAAMAPGTHLGAAHPVGPEGKDIPGAMGEKAVQDTAAFARGLAELRGRNIALAEAIVSKSRSFTAHEAMEQDLIEILAESRKDLFNQVHGKKIILGSGTEHVLNTRNGIQHELEMTWGQKVLHFLANPNIATLLMTLGLICLYIEISTPGLQIAGIIGILSLIVAFMALQMLPIQSGGLVLIVLGILFLLAEFFVTTHGILAAGGTLALILGFLWLMDPGSTDLRVNPAIWVPVAIILGGGAVLLSWVALRSKKKIADERLRMGGGSEAGLIGYRGRIEIVFDPPTDSNRRSGKARIRGEVWDVWANEAIQKGDEIEVVHVHPGMKVEVKRTLPQVEKSKKGDQ